MENKQSFGAYILRRRKELGMTQKEFAEKLYVTESAVSKWERGMSYPDITLIRSICAVLEVDEHELLTGGEDTERRNSERLAAKYLRMSRNYRLVQYILYGGTALVCLVVNLIVQRRLDWSLIVLSSLLTAASVTLVPAIAGGFRKTEAYKAPIAFGSFTLSLLLLLLTCCVYTGGDWFFVAAVSVLFGFGVVFLPFFMPLLPLPQYLSGCKSSLWLLFFLFMLLLLLFTCCVHTGGGWFFIAAAGSLLGLGFFILPVLLVQLPLPGAVKRHKALVYFSVQTLLLFIVIALSSTGSFLYFDLPVTLLSLLLPWGLMLILRYLPLRRLFRASLGCFFAALWFFFFPYLSEKIVSSFFGEGSFVSFGGLNYPFPALSFDFTDWSGAYIGLNIYALLVLGLTAAGLLLLVLSLAGGKPRAEEKLDK